MYQYVIIIKDGVISTLGSPFIFFYEECGLPFLTSFSTASYINYHYLVELRGKDNAINIVF